MVEYWKFHTVQSNIKQKKNQEIQIVEYAWYLEEPEQITLRP